MRQKDRLLVSDTGPHKFEAGVKVVDRSESPLSERIVRTPIFGSTSPCVLLRRWYTTLRVSGGRTREAARKLVSYESASHGGCYHVVDRVEV